MGEHQTALLRGLSTAIVAGLVLGTFAPDSTTAAPPSLYKGSAQRLMPTAAEAGYAEITSQAGTGSRASAIYQSPGTTPRSMKIAIRAFKTEAAAKASFEAACAGCSLRQGSTGPGAWKYKLRVEPGVNVMLVARCRNLRVDTTMATTATNPHTIAGPSRRVIDGIFVTAMKIGMSPCGGTGSPPPTTGSYYWTESYAEEIVVSKVRIPYCNAYPTDPQCRLGSSLRVVSAQCRGLDEKPGTFTFSRFTCDILVGYGGRIRGRIAVWPTGPTTLRWEII